MMEVEVVSIALVVKDIEYAEIFGWKTGKI
jgi:hypothetical protein